MLVSSPHRSVPQHDGNISTISGACDLRIGVQAHTGSAYSYNRSMGTWILGAQGRVAPGDPWNQEMLVKLHRSDTSRFLNYSKNTKVVPIRGEEL